MEVAVSVSVFDIVAVAARPDLDAHARSPVFLVEISGFATPDDDRLVSFVDNTAGVVAANIVGAYAVPLDGALGS